MKEPISEWNMYDKAKIGDLMPAFELLQGDCLQQLTTLPAASVDAVVCDPPYGLRFMGKDWDHGVPGVAFWAAAMRVAKPGAHLLAFGGTRTFHRLAVAIEDAGWEIRDTVMWVYGSGYPKSHNVANSIDKMMGQPNRGRAIPTASKYQASDIDEKNKLTSNKVDAYVSRTPESAEWEGWGTALKPAWEPILVCRKPLEGTVAANVLAHGTGGLNIDGCRVGTDGGTAKGSFPNEPSKSAYGDGLNGACDILDIGKGRWPANLIHDGSEKVLAGFPASKSTASVRHNGAFKSVANGAETAHDTFGHADSGSAARFFYCAKASKADRDEGCDGMPLRDSYMVENGSKTAAAPNGVRYDRTTQQRNHHPTVKPTALMRYLCKLVTPPAGTVLDPFMGSGSTGKAAVLEGFNFIGIEKDAEYIAIARARIASAISREHAANAETSV